MNPHISNSQASLLSKFIDSIEVKLNKAEYREITKPFYYSGLAGDSDVFVGFIKGNYFPGLDDSPAQQGSFYFIPRGQKVNAGTLPVSNQSGNSIESFSDDVKQAFVPKVDATISFDQKENVINFISFETMLYHAFPFFPLLDLPAFVIPPDDKLAFLLREICIEKEQNQLGKDVVLKNYLSEIIVQLFRFIESQPELKKSIEKLTYLTDVRLIEIVKYIENNLDKDLTNAAIAKVAYVSDDYVGQFFKALTGRTLQDYIEDQRLDRAMRLLKTIPNSVQEVAAMVGFKDAAYFSRRFRMRFAVNANAVRQGKTQEI
ncbi:N/A [soil metagenome]